MADTLILENAHTRLEFVPDHGGLARMLDKKSSVEHVHAGKAGYLLWELVYRHGTREQTLTNLGARATQMAATTASDGGQRATLTWANVRHWHEDNAVTVRVTVDLPAEDGVAEWRISVDNHSNLWGLWEVRFPYFTHMLVPGEYDLAFAANNWGNLLRKFTEERTTTFAYPSCEWALPFIALTRETSSVYLGAHDPRVWAKTYKVKPGERCYLGTFVENMAEQGSGYPGHYPVLAGVYQGDWLTACKRYRAWVRSQPWMVQGPLSQRSDVPQSIKETALWVREIWDRDNPETDPHKLNAPLLEAQAYYGVPLGVHWYLWHHNVFDKDYPFFFPARAGFKERVAELVAHGLLVMPYINTVIADYDHPEYRAKLWPAATKDQTGAPYWLPIATDEAGRMTNMCPYTEVWQDTIAGLVDRLTGECGVNAVYLDLLAASPPDLCFDRSHGHPLGGGGWWWQGTQAMLKKVKAIAVARGVALTSESIADPYMNGSEGFLTWAPPIAMEIPMMPAVYSGYALYIASPTAPHITLDAFVAAQARVFTWGCQNGWMSPGLHKDPKQAEKAAYLKQIAQHRFAARKFLTYGELLHLLPPAEAVPTVTVYWPDYKGIDQPVEQPCVLGALWQAEDGHLGVILCNITNMSVTYPYRIDAVGCGLPAAGRYRIRRITPEGESILGECPAGLILRTESLAPREIKVLEIETAGGYPR